MSDRLPDPEMLDSIALANAKAKGKRPYFFQDPDVERVLSITMAVAGEFGGAAPALGHHRGASRGARQHQQGGHRSLRAPMRRSRRNAARWNQEYLARILRIVQQEREAIQRGAEPTSEEAGQRMVEDE